MRNLLLASLLVACAHTAPVNRAAVVGHLIDGQSVQCMELDRNAGVEKADSVLCGDSTGAVYFYSVSAVDVNRKQLLAPKQPPATAAAPTPPAAPAPTPAPPHEAKP